MAAVDNGHEALALHLVEEFEPSDLGLEAYFASLTEEQVDGCLSVLKKWALDPPAGKFTPLIFDPLRDFYCVVASCGVLSRGCAALCLSVGCVLFVYLSQQGKEVHLKTF